MNVDNFGWTEYTGCNQIPLAHLGKQRFTPNIPHNYIQIYHVIIPVNKSAYIKVRQQLHSRLKIVNLYIWH